jgi:hypothetical protein
MHVKSIVVASAPRMWRRSAMGSAVSTPLSTLPHVFSINTLAAYILTALIERPKRLVYLSAGMHQRPPGHALTVPRRTHYAAGGGGFGGLEGGFFGSESASNRER